MPENTSIQPDLTQEIRQIFDSAALLVSLSLSIRNLCLMLVALQDPLASYFSFCLRTLCALGCREKMAWC